MLKTIADVLNPDQVQKIVDILNTSNFVDGGVTAGKRAKRVKKNEQLERNADAYHDIQSTVVNALIRNEDFQACVRPRVIEHPLFSRYKASMEYGFHVDEALMGTGATRTDVSITIFLNNPSDYDGGELEIQSAYGPALVKLPKGHAVVYPGSTVHRVRPVTKGERLVAISWAQSLVRDPAKRELLYDLGRIYKFMDTASPESPETDLAQKTFVNLTRMWVE